MASSRELAEKAFSLLQDALQDSESRAAELDAELKKKRAPRNKAETQARVLEHRLESILTENEQWQREAAQLEELLENERARVQQLKKKLEIAESGPDKVDKKEVNYWRSRAEQFDADTRQYKERIAELRQSLRERPEPEPAIDPAELERLQAAAVELEQLKPAAADAEKAGARAEAELGERESQLTERNAQIENLNAQIASFNARIESLDTQIESLNDETSGLRSQLAARESEIAERDQRISELTEAKRVAEEEKQAVRDQIAELEEELKEEKECAVNLGELANERREQITELSEKLDEALERYDEAKWRLQRASRFERLVNKRRKLIDSLIEGLRGKQKSNIALKAGLDGLRKFKARAEQQQQKLLVRVEELTSELREAEEQLSSRQGSQETDEKLRRAGEMIANLEERLDTQVQVIDNLETELNAAKAARQSTDSQDKELAELKAMLDARNETIARLESDIDEQQNQLNKLRGSESETMRLKAVQEEDQSLIERMQEEIDNLRTELARQQELAASGAHDSTDASATGIRRRDAQIADLKRTVKDQEREIDKLNEAAAGWQKKYEFLSTEAPSAYQNVAAEE